jgi:WD40 repeat protein/serine/threonine protein kinase
MPVDPKRLKELFLAASEMPSPDERAALLERECGTDVELRRRLEVLLRAHDESGGFLAQPAEAPVATVDSAAEEVAGEPTGGEAVGDVIGPYKLLQKLGEGGMGTVWVAEQQRPVKRRVALKVIKPGLDSAQVLRRFEAERQALALMDHTNIAKVFDAGTTESGRPFFVMELVHGVPITRYCDELNLPIRERLGLFVPVCQAIQHAHQKGIIHRDVKPSNVLVCMQDGNPVAKVIDFGVAKAMNQRLTEGTVYTEFGAVVGTLEYMAPEQAEMSPLGVDTRADVYALGVLLYELLTGTTPLDHKRVKQAAFLEVLRLIKEEEPPRPSTRLTQSKETLAGVAARRRTAPTRLTKEVRGELDWIVMRCLEKDRTRRYETASALARDVEHYLAGELVEACPPSAAYRLRRVIRRNKVAFATAALIAAVLLLATVVSTTQAVRARTAEGLAREEGSRAEELARTEAAAHAEAQGQATLANQRAEDLAHRLYIHRVNLAYREAMANNVAQADALLGACEAARRGWEWTFCKRLCHLEAMTLGGPADNAAAGARQGPPPDEGAGDAAARNEPRAVTGVPVAVRGVACSPDGRRIAAAKDDGLIDIWDAGSGRLVRSLSGHVGVVTCVAFDADGGRLISGGFDGTVRVWDANSGGEKLVLRGHSRPVTSVAFRPGAEQAASSTLGPWEAYQGSGIEIKQWDLAAAREVRTLYHLQGWSDSSLAFSPDGRRLVSSAAWSGFLRVWDAENGKEVVELPGDPGSRGLAISPADGQIAFSGPENTVGLRAPVPGTEARYFHGHSGLVMAVAFSADGARLASASEDGTVKVWGVADGREVRHLRGHTGCVTAVAFGRDGHSLVSGSEDGTVKVWDLSSARHLFPLRRVGWCFRIRFAPDGRRTAISRWRGVTVAGADGVGSAFELGIPDGWGGVPGLDYSRDGRLIATCGEFSDQVLTWDAGTGRQVAACRGHDGRVRNVAFGAGSLLASAGDDGTVRLWDAATGRAGPVLRAHPGGAFGVAFDPAGERLATIGWDGAVRLWDARTGEAIRRLGTTVQRMSNAYGDALAFDPAGRRLAAAGDDGTVHVWEVGTGGEVFTLRGHTQEVNSVAYSPDGRRIATCAQDHTIKLWDAASGDEVFTLRGHTGGVLGLAFSPDGHRILSTGTDGMVWAWDGSPLASEPR